MLIFHSGSYAFDSDLPVTLKPPDRLTMCGEDVEENVVHLSPAKPYQSQECKLRVFTTPEEESETVKHMVRDTEDVLRYTGPRCAKIYKAKMC